MFLNKMRTATRLDCTPCFLYKILKGTGLRAEGSHLLGNITRDLPKDL
jgi:hypothetical protein